MDLSKCKQMNAFVIGYTGEIGKELSRLLLKHKIFNNVVLIGRRKVEYTEAIDEDLKNAEQVQVDYDDLDSNRQAFNGCQVGFCCLGTTRAKSGKDGFIKVDHDYVVNTAKIAKEYGGCTEFHLVTSMGSNKNAFFLYPKTKGETEEDVKAMGFNYAAIYRPAFLLCDRAERRIGERLAHFAIKPLSYAAPTFMSIPTIDVARAMIFGACSKSRDEANQTFENAKLHEMAKQFVESVSGGSSSTT